MYVQGKVGDVYRKGYAQFDNRCLVQPALVVVLRRLALQDPECHRIDPAVEEDPGQVILEGYGGVEHPVRGQDLDRVDSGDHASFPLCPEPPALAPPELQVAPGAASVGGGEGDEDLVEFFPRAISPLPLHGPAGFHLEADRDGHTPAFS